MIILDYKDGKPLYQQVIEQIKRFIMCGILEEGEQLASVRNLAIELSINPNTIQRAYFELEKEGLIVSVKGKGSFVANATNTKIYGKQKMFEELNEWLIRGNEMGIQQQEVLEQINVFFEERERKQ